MFRRAGSFNIDLEQLFNLSPNPYVILDRDMRMLGCNDAYLTATMRQRDDIIDQLLFDAFPSDPEQPSGQALRRSLNAVFTTGKVDHIPILHYPIANAQGVLEDRYWSATHTPVRDGSGQVVLVLQHTMDVTELHRLRAGAANPLSGEAALLARADAVQGENAALGREREYLRQLFDQAPGFMAVMREPNHVFTIANRAYRALVGHEDLIGRSIREAMPEIAGQGIYEMLDEVFRSGQPHVAKAALFLLRPRADEPPVQRYLDFVCQPIKDETGAVAGIFVQGHDVTELKLAQDAASESENRFRTLAQSLPNQVWTARPDGSHEWSNQRTYDYCGLTDIGFTADRRSALVHPGDAERINARWTACLASGQAYEAELRLRRHDGVYRWFIGRSVPVVGPEGQILRWVGTNTDIHDRKVSETALENRVEEQMVELERTQAVLRQSQKMEAIGNLAGGIAHDFNNLLQVITGNLQLLAKEVAGNEVAARRLNNALSGAARGGRLASQLLSFGRRQPLAPTVVNLGRLVGEMDHLLRRSLGDAIDIDTIIGDDLWTTQVDTSNVENAILNLAINARDAMNGQGKLTIELGNIDLDDAYAGATFDMVPGQYVMLAVSDTGSGMTADVLEKVFDPFFTTKPEGRGTGLGLSMVYGFVKQSGGHIRIYSEPGEGTTVRLYLPRSHAEEDLPSQAVDTAIVGGKECILVVEDDDAVREVTVSLLGELGYRVLKARDADGGLAIVESGVTIDLLFTDVVMPGRLRSHELARIARQRLPRLGVLFTSGYTENSIVHGGRLDAGVNLLSKPYTREALARKIRQVLDDARADAGRPDAQADWSDPQALGALSGNAAAVATQPPVVVLLCEDEALIRISIADYLQDEGMTVVEAGNAAEAIEAFDRQPSDILVTDVNLPNINGVDLARTLRQTAPGLPVIFATGDREAPNARDLKNALVITKPYDYDLLASHIRSMLRR